MRTNATVFVLSSLALLRTPAQLPSTAPAPGSHSALHSGSIPPISSADLLSDAATLRTALEAIHPGLYRSNTKEQMEAHYAALHDALSHDQSRAQAFLALSEFTAKIRCGHTFANPANQTKATRAELFGSASLVPFTFRWLDGRMIVTRDLTPERLLKPGDEILQINGVPTGVILEKLLPIARADGANDAKRVSLLEVTGAETVETFDIYFPLVFPLASPEFKLTFRSPSASAQRSLAVGAMTPDARRAAAGPRPASEEREDQALWRLTTLPDGTPCLPMNSWVAYKTKWDWTGFLNETFDSLAEKGVPNLVIDLRGNEGGSSVGDVILARLIQAPVPRSTKQRFVHYVKVPADLEGVLDTWDPSFKDWSKEAIGPVDLAGRGTGLAPGTTGGYYRLRNEDGKDPELDEQKIHPRGPRFRGRVFVLVDASNSSATFEFASRVKALGLATLVGRPTGGSQRGINGGAFFFLRLPKTGLEIDIPIIAQFQVGGTSVPDDTGVVPDVLVTTTQSDIARSVDADLNAVQRLIHPAREVP